MADMDRIGGLHYDIMRRCYNENYLLYKQYGGSGIKVCDQWHDREAFRKWCIENGWKRGYRLKRKDTSKGYCPENCYFSETGKKKCDGYNQTVLKRAKEHKGRKKALGVTRVTDSPLYLTYTSMMTRCYNPKHKAYSRYGGRGIKVCREWTGTDGIYNFLEWASYAGWEKGLTLDRIDNDKGYSPNNCRFTTRKEQIKNRCNTRYFMYNGKKMTISEISKITGVSYGKLYFRLIKGMSVEDALKECL